MKRIKVSIIVLLLFFLVSCKNKNTKLYDYTCKRPADIPTHFDNGEPIEWDCVWHFYYKEGKVIVIRNEKGEPIALAQDITE